jgi:hypothetical protein
VLLSCIYFSISIHVKILWMFYIQPQWYIGWLLIELLYLVLPLVHVEGLFPLLRLFYTCGCQGFVYCTVLYILHVPSISDVEGSVDHSPHDIVIPLLLPESLRSFFCYSNRVPKWWRHKNFFSLYYNFDHQYR